MIKSITLKNFFSFEEQTVRLNPKVNLLVGINGSGKSNFIKAFELLRFGINEDGINHLINDNWKDRVVWNYWDSKQEKPLCFSIDIDSQRFLNDKKEHNNLTYRLEINSLGGFQEEIDILGETKKGYRDNSWSSGNLLADNWVVEDRNLGKLKNFISQIEIYDSTTTIHNAQIRNDPKNRELYQTLSPKFDNLSGVLNTMSIKPETEDAFDKIYTAINDINVNLKGIHFGLDENKKLYIQINNLPSNIMTGLQNFSDGTIKFLLLMSILYNPDRGNIVCIDEPENHLHPDMINMVAKGIKHASQTSQMIVSTHSPFLLNAFELEDVLVFENDEKNNTIVKELSQDDFEEWTDDFMIGQLWVNGFIGGKRW